MQEDILEIKNKRIIFNAYHLFLWSILIKLLKQIKRTTHRSFPT
jgi:hypothetical protein